MITIMHQQEEDIFRIARNVFRELNHALETGPWQNSLFLKSIGDKLQRLRDQFAAVLEVPDSTMNAEVAAQSIGKCEVFISLYQAQGDNLSRWRNMVANLSEFCTSRPIYQREADVQASIPIGHQERHHAYVVVSIAPEDILSTTDEEGPQLDRAGRKLVRLKEEAVKSANITRFVHASGQYKWVKNFLVKQEDEDSAWVTDSTEGTP